MASIAGIPKAVIAALPRGRKRCKRETVFRLLADYIMEEESTALRCLAEDFCPLTDNDFYHTAKGYLDQSKVKRQEAILGALRTLQKETAVFRFDGFVRFRLGDYRAYVSKAVMQALADQMARDAQSELTQMLRAYLSEAPRTGAEAHLYGYRIADAQGCDITAKPDGQNTQGDLLIETLLSLRPEKIYIHMPPDEQTLAFVKAVFSPGIIYV